MRPKNPKPVLLGVSLIFCIALVEVTLRILIGPPAVYRFPQESYVHDERMGHKLLPGDESFTHDRRVSIDSAGLRGPEYERSVPTGTRRILAIGDSQTFGNGLDLADTWPSRLEKLLAGESPDRRWEVVNAGISATDTWQHAEWLREISQRIEFDVAILGFYVNDVTPRYVTPPARELTNTLSKRVGYILKRSALFTMAWQVWKMRSTGSSVIDHERHILTGEPDDAVTRGWEEVERSLEAMERDCRALGVPLLLVVIPRRDQVDETEVGTAYNTRIRAIGDRLGIPVADALEPLREAFARDGRRLFIPWDGHNTGLANEVIARTILEQFRRPILDRGAASVSLSSRESNVGGP